MIYVSSLSAVDRAVKQFRPAHMVSLLHPDRMIETPAGIQPDNHLKLGLNDISEPTDGQILPDRAHVEQLIGFAAVWPRRAPLLIHCWAGVSRSTAATYITLCLHNGDGSEGHIARRLRASAPHAQPNRRIVALADDCLGRNGRMIAAIEAIGPGDIQGEDNLFAIAVEQELESCP